MATGTEGKRQGQEVFPPSILPDSVAVVSLEQPPEGESLEPVERERMASAVPSRVAEFSAGRWCARAALLRLGIEPVAIPVSVSRAPEWPDGVVGSITHTDGCYAAAVARRTDLVALGIDAEAADAIDDRVAARIMSPGERKRLEAHEGGWRGAVPVVFSAKESLYKMYHPATGSSLDFQDVDVEVDLPAGTFRARIVRDERPPIRGRREFEGRFLRVGRLTFSALWLSS